jgi:hypothetical protein
LSGLSPSFSRSALVSSMESEISFESPEQPRRCGSHKRRGSWMCEQRLLAILSSNHQCDHKKRDAILTHIHTHTHHTHTSIHNDRFKHARTIVTGTIHRWVSSQPPSHHHQPPTTDHRVSQRTHDQPGL